jgi:cytochrome c-type biogenesis protein CcmF
MNPELGQIALIIALMLSTFQAFVPMVGSFVGAPAWMKLGQSMALGQFVFAGVAFTCLSWAFVTNDFSVAYVANNSNTLLPLHYKLSAVWGAHEGSLLLWVLILAGWSAMVAIRSDQMPPVFTARVLSVLGFISVGFLLFLLLTSNPFERILPIIPAQGSDLNPLLQDIGLILHPPMLYMGYVGFAVPFAFAISALIGGQFDSAWARWCRPWINVSWVFLTIGICLGSWWAYYELGWGGWWFWDPVENASFMPWLVGTALVHSVAATEKRGVFRSWTLLLAIFAFSLSLLGAFLVRSGILTSVHAFASDPERGVYILAFLVIVIGGSLLLFALRGPQLASSAKYSFWSREAMLLINNVLLVSSMSMILIGTLYPLVADVLGFGKISVGPPYFDFFFVPITAMMMIFLGIAMFTRWRSTETALLLKKGAAPMFFSVLLALVLPIVIAGELSWKTYSISAVITLFLSLWVISMTLEDILLKYFRQSLPWRSVSASYWGMVTAHIGLATCVLGVGLSSSYDLQRDLRMAPGDSADLGSYQFRFVGVESVDGPNFVAYRGAVEVMSQGDIIASLYPEKRNYRAGGQIMTEAAIDAKLHRDIYVSLAEPLADDAWALRLQIKPFVRLIWLGALFVALGGTVAAMDKRYRRKRRSEKAGLEELVVNG